MRKINIFLAVALALMLAAGAYFMLGTGLKVEAAAEIQESGIECRLKIRNGSIFACECIEFIALAPDGARIVQSAGEGEDVPALSERDMRFTLACENPVGAQVEIGYYVLGSRRTVTVTLK